MAKPKAKKPKKPVPNPTNTPVTSKTITKLQIARLRAMSLEAGDTPMVAEIDALYDRKSSVRRKKTALDYCVTLHNDLITIKSR